VDAKQISTISDVFARRASLTNPHMNNLIASTLSSQGNAQRKNSVYQLLNQL
jgi:hypothetical protein